MTATPPDGLTRPDPIHIFVSSPNDVAAERAACLRVIALLNKRYEGRLRLEGVFWEEHFFPASADFQSWIDQRTPPWACPLVVCILWSRIGSPLSDAWPRREDGTPYESGTAWEFERTLPYARTGPLPDLYMFAKVAPTSERNAGEKQRAAQAREVVERFIQRWFHQADAVASPGAPTEVHPFTAGFNPFETTDAFEDLFVRFLEWWLNEKQWLDRAPAWDRQRLGLPYVGLAAFDVGHSTVFFGRDADRRSCRHLLTAAANDGFPYLLLLGGSGVGKSSLARAGLVADICVDTPKEIWTAAIMLAGPDPCMALAEALFADGCALRPYLAASLLPDVAKLATGLAGGAALASTIIGGALDAMAESIRAARFWQSAPTARLLLILDQTEALLQADPATQAAFVAVLTACVASGRIWLVATLRADRLTAMLAAPDLAKLVTRDLLGKGAVGAEYKLAAPDAAAIRDIIEAPATAAGLSFETRAADGRDLATELQAAVAGQPDALPLLQHLLERLFRDGSIARWDDYDAIGGLPGAIATAANEALDRLPPEHRSDADLRALILALVAGIGDDGSVVSRTIQRDAFVSSPSRAALVGALGAARLLPVDEKGELRVAHEALLRAWPRATTIIGEEEAYLRLLDRLRPLARTWREHGTVLPPGPLLSSGADLLQRLQGQDELASIADFLTASLRAEQRSRLRRLRVVSAVASGFAVLAAVAIWLGLRAEAERGLAERNFLAASSAVRGLVFDLAIGLRHQEGMSVDAVAHILARAETALQTLTQDAPDNLKLLALRVAGQRAVAETYLSANDTTRAAAAARAAQQLADDLVGRDPGNPAWKREQAISDERVGDVLKAQGDWPGALTAYQRGLTIIEALTAAQPNDLGLQRDLAVGLEKIADGLLAHGDRAGALDAYRRADALRAALVSRQPDNAEWQRDLSVSREKIGDLLQLGGDLDGAQTAYRAAAAIRQHLADSDTKDLRARGDLADIGQKLGDVLLQQGNDADAVATYRTAVDTLRALTLRDPDNSDWQRALLVADHKLGDALLHQHDATGTLAAYRDALAIARRLAARNPGDSERQRDLAGSLERTGDIARQQNDLPTALHDYQESMAIIQALVARDKDATQWQRDLSIKDNQVGDVKRAMGDAQGALAAYRDALAIRQQLTVRDPSNVLWQRDLSASQTRIGSVLADLGDLAGALDADLAARDIVHRLAARMPDDLLVQQEAARAERRVAPMLLMSGQLPEALAAFQANFAIADRLASRVPSDQATQHDRILALEQLASATVLTGDADAARPLLDRLSALIDAFAQQAPANPVVQVDRATLATMRAQLDRATAPAKPP